jgi:nucleotide-binding universal stress UspA family protein
MAVAPVTRARVTLLHVLERAPQRNGNPLIDPLSWHMQKQELQAYLDRAAQRLQALDIQVEQSILEGNPAETIIEFARSNAVDLIVLSTHGRTGLTAWNVSSVVQKILMLAYKSILLVRAHIGASDPVQYERLFLAVDGSMRAEFILPFAVNLALHHQTNIVLGTVIPKPARLQRFPLSGDEEELINRLNEKNQSDASHYLSQLATQLSLKGLSTEVNILASENVMSTLYDMVEAAHADLVMIAAHGQSGERRWPYGSMASALIAYGHTPLMILQDLPDGEAIHAERAIREGRGR